MLASESLDKSLWGGFFDGKLFLNSSLSFKAVAAGCTDRDVNAITWNFHKVCLWRFPCLSQRRGSASSQVCINWVLSTLTLSLVITLSLEPFILLAVFLFRLK